MDKMCFKCEKGAISKVSRSRPVKYKVAVLHLSYGNLSREQWQRFLEAFLCKLTKVRLTPWLTRNRLLRHISERFVKIIDLKLNKSAHIVGLAVEGLTSERLVMTTISVKCSGTVYDNIRTTIFKDLLTDVNLGQDFMHLHQNVDIHFGELRPTMHSGPCILDLASWTLHPGPCILDLASWTLHPGATLHPVADTLVRLFTNVTEGCPLTATPERKYSKPDKIFISSEVKRLLSEGLTEPSNSPWRAQPLVVTQENHRKRMVIDYSQTMNRFTQLDAYPLPHMQDVAHNFAQYNVYSTWDLKRAYHQLESPAEDLYTAYKRLVYSDLYTACFKRTVVCGSGREYLSD